MKDYTLSYRNERHGSKGIHNGRQFDMSNATHIDQNKVNQNMYYTWNKGFGNDLRAAELAYYNINYSAYLKKKNERAIKAGHKERMQTMEQYYRSRNSCPEETIIQLGNCNSKEQIDSKTMWKIAMKFKDDVQRLSHCVVLSMAMHVDECSIHVHLRRTYPAKHEKIEELYNCQSQLLKEYSVVDGSTKYNNAKTELTEQERTNLIYICHEHDINIIKSDKSRRYHIGTKEYKAEEISKEVEILEREYGIRFCDIPKRLEKLKEEEEKNRSLKEALERAKEELKRKMFLLLNDPKQLLDEFLLKERKKKKLAEEFIKRTNLWKEYQEFIQQEDISDVNAATPENSIDQAISNADRQSVSKKAPKTHNDHDDR